jgi:hypothetical protein
MPNSILDVMALDDCSAVRPATNHILIDDPFHKVHVFRVFHDPIEILPVPQHGSIIPPSSSDLGVLVEAPAVEPVPVQGVVTPHFKPVLCRAPGEIRTVLSVFRKLEVLCIDRLTCVFLLAWFLFFDHGMGRKVARAITLSVLLRANL